ncbi:MAG: TetR/AcrR family transcriptional regulator [Candidatus Ornithomonoglobus sp.]
MDLRIKRTTESIRDAFIKLRGKKPIEKISVKELSELADINKATFYLHYRDIYDLSETVERTLIDEIFSSIDRPDLFLDNPGKFTADLFRAYIKIQPLADIIFSGSRRHSLIDNIEIKMREVLSEKYPELKDNMRLNILLTYEIQGAYYAYSQNKDKYNSDELIEIISGASDALSMGAK